MRAKFICLMRSESGASIVEAAVIAPLYFMLVLGILGWGLVMWSINSLQYAAEKSARCSVLPMPYSGSKQCNTYTDVTTNLIDWIPGISSSSVTPASSPATAQSYVNGSTKTVNYATNCITVSVANNFVPSLLRVNTLTQNYCRTVQ